MRSALHSLKFFWTEKHFPWLAAGLGAFAALWVVLNNQGVVNNDAVLYIRVASFLASGDWKQATDLYNWPFYSLILAAGHFSTGLNFQIIGHLFSITTFALSTVLFVLILREAGGNRDVMVAGVLVFLSSPYLLGDVVPSIVREHGFWVCLLSGLWCLMRFYTSNQFRYALGWGVALVLATLFRIEALSFLTLLPFALFFQSRYEWKTRFAMVLKAHSVLFVSLIILAVLLLNYSIGVNNLGRLYEPMNITTKAFHEMMWGLNEKAQVYGAQVLGKWIDDYALQGLLLTLGWVVVSKVILAAGIAQSLLCIFTIYNRRVISGLSAGPILVGFIMIGFINSIFILLNNFLLSERMTSPLAFAIQICAAYGLVELYRNFQETKKKSILISFFIVAILLAGQLGKTLWPLDRGDRYELDAVKWLESYKKPQQKVFYDSMRLRYYAGEYHDSENIEWESVQKLFAQNDMRKYDYIVVTISRKNPEKLKFLNTRLGKAIKQFDNGRKNRVLIYRITI